MFNKLKKKFTEIKTDLNHKIDQLEVDKNHILNKTQKSIDARLASNGIQYLLKKDESLTSIQNMSRDNELNSQMFDKEVKERALVQTTNLFHTIRTLEKEISLVNKTIETFRSTIEKCELFCIKLNNDLFELENVYEDLELEKQIEQLRVDEDLTKDLEMEKILADDDEKIELKDKSIKLTIAFDN